MELRARVHDVLAEVLRDGSEAPVSEAGLDLDASFVDLGINSLRSVAAVELLNERLGIELGVEVMFDYVDAAELAAFIQRQYGERLGVPAAAAVRVTAEPGDRDVAVIGMSGRFAGSPDLHAFWRHLAAGDDCVGEIDRPGWRLADYWDPDPRRANRSISRWGGLLAEVDRFDPRFFGIAPATAEYLDPQQRLFLQESYRAFEDAGYAPDGLGGGRVGVFAAARSSDYKEQVARAGRLNSEVFLGTDLAILAARVAYALNLKGPNLTVDTACSSSLVALHLAVRSIRTGESELALAGGVFVLTSPEFYVLTSQTNMLSPDGRCKTFDDGADGIVVGEGVGAVVLKGLRAALADGDHVHGVIKGSAVNQDGRTKGITAPSMLSQKALLQDAYADAGVDPQTLGYLEAHGTGTRLGDPIEVKALTEVISQDTDRTGFVALGSHKGNIGHTIMTAGLAGVFKALLAMRHRALPPTLHVRRLNRHLDLDRSPLYVNTELRQWPAPAGHPRRAGVSSFGFGGTNAHVVLEEAPQQAALPEDEGPQLFVLSGRTADALGRRRAELADVLDAPGDPARLTDVACTLALGRTHFPHRWAALASTRAELLAALRGDPPAPAGPAAESLLTAAERYRRGDEVDWAAVFAGCRHRRVPLPGYPFAGESYWIGSGWTPPDQLDVPAEDEAEDEAVALLEPIWSAPGERPAGPPADQDAERVLFAGPGVPAGPAAERLDGFEAGAVRLVERLRDRLTASSGPLLVQLVVEEQDTLGGLFGVLLAARHEHPRIRCQLLEVPTGSGTDAVRGWLRDAGGLPSAVRLQASADGLAVGGWAELPALPARPPWRQGGVYLVTGGQGGLARLLVAEIGERLQSATVVLAGRSPAGALPEPASAGVRVQYRRADVTDPEAVRALVAGVLAEHGTLTGVLHAAGVVHDGYLARKTAEQIRAVLAPKLAGTRNLDEATAELPLDFFVLFGSITGPLGIAGRADYAAANAYLDRFAAQREALRASGRRRGSTLAVDWPVWADGGMQVDPEVLAAMRQDTGFTPLTTGAGLRALYRALAAGRSQVLVASGELPRIRAALQGTGQGTAGTAVTAPAGPVGAVDVAARLLRELTELAARFLRVAPDELDPGTDLHAYGFDSITLTAFTNRLNDSYGLTLTPPVLFEHVTLGQLTDHLVETFPDSFGRRWPAASPAASAGPGPAAPIAPARARRRPARGRDTEPVAVIGMSGRFPMAADVPTLWANLLAGTDGIGTGLQQRWGSRHDGHPWAGLIEGIEEFDPAFFGISRYEAEQMDPQQRLLMMYVWRALEDAGHAPGSLAGTDTGLFVATFDSGYGRLAGTDRPVEAHTSIGQTPSLGPNRMSFHLDLHGPSEPVETACSSSLVAVHRALDAIALGDCELAVAGGVNLLVDPSTHTSLAKAGLLSAAGRCRTFSADADGFVRGEGVGMLVLKPLSAAERDGDQIHGLIIGSAVNHGGHAQSLTAPNPRAQADLLVTAYRRAGVQPSTIGYLEAHGTGTKLGDPIEINGLRTAFEELSAGGPPPRPGSCGLGSIKSNIGHLELAAGVAGMIKVLLQLRHRTLLAGLHTSPVNPYIELAGSPFQLVEQTGPWPAPQDADGRQLPRRAGVSSFGIGGVNAHVVLEEYVGADDPAPTPPGRPALVLLSARTEEQLREQAGQLLAFLRSGGCPEPDLGRLAYTLQVGRDAMECRWATTATGVDGLAGSLARFLAGDAGGWYQARTRAHRDAVALFGADQDPREAPRRWLEQGQHDTVLDWWTRGLEIDWTALYPAARPRRMSLPGYPFARERYWLAAPAEPPGTPPAPSPPPPPTQPGSYLGGVRRHLEVAFAGRTLSTLDGTE